MTHHWDEFSKTLAEPLPRRESLRRIGLVFAGAVLSPMGLRTALARGTDPCKSFCRCSSRTQQNACLAACRACNNDPSRLCGSCGSYVCCGSGRTCCSGYCTDVAEDILNCGACGFVCDEPGPWEFGACIDGSCEYVCAEGAVYCNGTCTFPDSDPDNCGGCGNVCPAAAPYCRQGICSGSPCAPGLTLCGSACVNLSADFFNCGACGRSCEGIGEYCDNGTCNNVFPPSE